MKTFTASLFTFLFLCTLNLNAQDAEIKSDFELIRETLMHYIEGTSNGEPERLDIAFHPDFNLYSVSETDSLKIWKGSDYVGRITPGKKNGRIGRIISIDHENDAATAKVEIAIPNYKTFVDYFLLLKYQGSWKIIHKSYTSRPVPSKE